MTTNAKKYWYPLIIVHLAAVYFFTKGFLLTRYETDRFSECHVQPDGTKVNLGLSDCWLPRRYKRAVIIVIDALRYDFVAWDNEFSRSNAAADSDSSNNRGAKDGTHRDATTTTAEQSADSRHFFLNHLPVIRDELRKDRQRERHKPGSGRHSLLYRFEADPPTVTMQRLKGLTTGGMPTFIDFKDNFGTSDVIDVDNLLKQLVKNNRKITFMGDDTWTDLFPVKEYFTRSYPYPSFNVKDLDTVDNGVISHLIPEIKEPTSKWDVIIAHFLGVDHAGHTFSPRHPRMSSKLEQMNEMLKTVFNAVDDDTVVVVFGDHGMTKDGNHGGSSSQEKRAALYIHTSENAPPLTHVSPGSEMDDRWRVQEESTLLVNREHGDDIHDGPRTVAQVDLLPTLSLLLGVPIPFENLGKVIPEIFHYSDKQSHSNSGSNLLTKGKQEHTVTCDDVSRLYHLSKALRLNALQQLRYMQVYSETASAISIEEFKPVIDRALKEHDRATSRMRTMCSADGTKTGTGTSTKDEEALKTILNCYVLSNRLFSQFMDDIYHGCRRQWTQFDIPQMFFGVALLLVAVVCVWWSVLAKQMLPWSTIGLLTVLTISHFSNSYIDAEVNILPFLSTTALLCYARRSFGLVSSSKKNTFNRRAFVLRFSAPSSAWWDVFASILAAIFVRITSTLLILNAPITLLSTMVPLFAIVMFWMYMVIRMDAMSWSTATVCLFVLFAHVLLLSHWALAGIGPSSNLASMQRRNSWIVRNGIPRSVFVCTIACYVIILIDRVCSGAANIVHKGDENENNVGRFWVTSASGELKFLLQRSLWVLPSMTLAMLLLGPGSPMAVCGIFGASVCIIFIQKRYSWHIRAPLLERTQGNAQGIQKVQTDNESIDWLNDEDVIVWWFMATLSYFATGHASTFGSIHISAAFIGIDEFHFGLSGLMLALNTWAGPILHAVAIGTIFGEFIFL
jgi:phosphatidylinositol glycan class O